MTIQDIKAEMQQLRNERTEFLRRAELAQDCLNELQRKMAIMKLEAQMDTPLGDTFGGWCPSSPATIFTYATNQWTSSTSSAPSGNATLTPLIPSSKLSTSIFLIFLNVRVTQWRLNAFHMSFWCFIKNGASVIVSQCRHWRTAWTISSKVT